MTNLIKKIFKNEYIISFILAFVIALAGFAAMGVYPFGKYAMTCSDMEFQFMDLTVGIFENLKTGKNLFVTWGGGMGINLYAWATYLLFDPLNVLFLIFDASYYQEVYFVIVLIKFAIIGLCTSIYLKNSNYTRFGGVLNVALSVLFVFGSFCLKSIINVMWLANVALLPILLLGIERVVEKRRIDLLFFSFLFCVTTNFYLSFITGLFSAFYFLFYIVNRTDAKQRVADIFKSIVLCGIGVVLVAGLCAVILLPTWKNISETYGEVFSSTATVSFLRWRPIDLLQCLFLVQEKSAIDMALHGFFGIFPLLTVLFFFLNKNIGKKEKISAAIFVIFMLASMIIRPLYTAWHIFREPTCFYGRFVYCIAFLFIMLSARCLKDFKVKNKKLLLLPALVLFLLAFCSISESTTYWLIKNLLIVTVYIIVYTAAMMHYKKPQGRTAAIISVFIISETAIAVFAGMYISKKLDTWPERDEYVNYRQDVQALKKEIDDDGFYRMTDVNIRTLNNGLGTGYNGMECFSSLTNQRSLHVASMLGLFSPPDYRVINNYFNTIVTDGLFGVKYIMVTDKDSLVTDKYGRQYFQQGGFCRSFRLASDNYEQIAATENGFLYRNKTAFPLMFSVNEEAIDVGKDFLDKQDYITGSYRTQAKLFNAMFGKDHKLYDECELAEPPLIIGARMENASGRWNFFDLKLTNLPQGAVLANEGDEVGKINYALKLDEDGEYFLDVRETYNMNDGRDLRYMTIVSGYVVDAEHLITNQMETPDIGPYKKGDLLTMSIQFMRDLEMVKPALLRLHSDEYKEFYDLATQNALSDIKQDGNDITATSNFDKDSLVFSTISYDNGFYVYVDGSEVEKIRIADGFLGWRVPAGSHNVRVKYISPGFTTGRNISLVFLALSVMALFFNRKAKSLKDLIPAEAETL